MYMAFMHITMLKLGDIQKNVMSSETFDAKCFVNNCRYIESYGV